MGVEVGEKNDIIRVLAVNVTKLDGETWGPFIDDIQNYRFWGFSLQLSLGTDTPTGSAAILVRGSNDNVIWDNYYPVQLYESQTNFAKTFRKDYRWYSIAITNNTGTFILIDSLSTRKGN